MTRTPISLSLSAIPNQFHHFLQDATIFDSSCSNQAKVYLIDKGPGFFLKKAPKGSLSKEMAMTRFFHSKGLGPEVLAYESLEDDWMLTLRVEGEDCLDTQYLSDPQRLCDTTAILLRSLHETDFSGCPICRTEGITRIRRI